MAANNQYAIFFWTRLDVRTFGELSTKSAAEVDVAVQAANLTEPAIAVVKYFHSAALTAAQSESASRSSAVSIVGIKQDGSEIDVNTRVSDLARFQVPLQLAPVVAQQPAQDPDVSRQ